MIGRGERWKLYVERTLWMSKKLAEVNWFLFHVLFNLTSRNPRWCLILVENDRRLRHYKIAETLIPREVIGTRLICEYFARLLNRDLHNVGCNRVVWGGTQTSMKVSKGGIQPESGFMYRILHMCVSMIYSGTQFHTENRGSRVLCRTTIRSSWLQTQLHFEIIVCAMLGTHLSKTCSLDVHTFVLWLCMVKKIKGP